jgi:hypothetical protein
MRGARSEAHPYNQPGRSQGQESGRLPNLHQLVTFSVGFPAMTPLDKKPPLMGI